MRYRAWVLCAAAVFGPAGGAPAQPKPEAPAGRDPFTDPIFNPPGVAKPVQTPPPGKPSAAPDASDPAAAPTLFESLCGAGNWCACSSGYTTWMTAEWVIGTTRGPSLVPVVTSGPASAGALAGAIGQPTTVPLFGGRPVLNDWRSGLRAEAGVWLDPDHRTGISARFYSLFSGTEAFAARPTGATVINVPQFTPTALGPVQTPLFVAFPGLTGGTVVAHARTSFAGGDLNVRRLLDGGTTYRVELLAGYRQLHLADELGTTFDASTAANPALAARVSGGDRVRTVNNFYGPQLGLYASADWNRFTLEGHAASALGVTVNELDFGRTRTLGAAPQVNAAGLIALGVPPATAAALVPAVRAATAAPVPLVRTSATDALTYLGVVGEGGGRLSWRATDHLRLTAGYSFIYWNNVRRAQDVFASGPALRSRAADFTTHLFSAGVDFRY